MEPLRPRLVAALAGLMPRGGTVAMHSTVVPGRLDGSAFDADYSGRNLREPIRFAGALASLPDAAVVEISPLPILAVSVGQGLAALGRGGHVLAAVRRTEHAATSSAEPLDDPAWDGK